jgi:hypothetical protein
MGVMNNNEVDLLFPSRAIGSLGKLRGGQWEKLIDEIDKLEPANPDRVAFVLCMVRISGCATCQSDSFRAMRGCVVCSSNTIKRFKGSDQNLIDLYNDARNDIDEYIKKV